MVAYLRARFKYFWVSLSLSLSLELNVGCESEFHTMFNASYRHEFLQYLSKFKC